MERSVCFLALSFLLICGIHMNLAAPVAPSDEEYVNKLALSKVDICPQITCGSTYMNITFLKSDLIRLKVDLANIHLIYPFCRGFADSDSTILIQSRVKKGDCGTQLSVNKTHALYKNNVFLPPDPSLVIYREEYIVDATCAYPLDMNVSLATALNPIISTIIIKLDGIGQFIVEMALFKDPAYSIPREQGDELTTQDFLYIGVLIVEGDTSRFDLVMKNCFATPTQNFYGTLKYYIIKNSCQNENDKTIHIAANGIASYGQFSVQAFKFLGGYNQIFLHCEVHLCDKTNGFCVPVCPAGGIGNPGSDDSTISLGSIAIKDPAKLCPDLQCGASYINVTFKKSDLIDSNMDIENLHLNENNCHDFHDSGSSVSLGWPLGAGQCGTTLITNATHAIYENAIHLTPNPSQIIYRHQYFINVSCAYPLDMNVSLATALNPIISTIIIKLDGIGQFIVKMALFKDPAYSIPREQGDELTTQDFLYIGVLIVEGDTSRFDLVMKNCFATPTQNFYGTLKYYIIKNSCENKNDKTISIAANGIASYGQFSVQAFKFLGGYNQIFLHCEVHLCDKTNGFCVPVCPAGGIGNPGSDDSTISLGSIAIKDPAKLCPDLQCGASYINVTFKKSDLIDSNMDIENLHLNENNCHDFHDSGSSVSLGWPLGAGQCGTTLITNATHAIYENAIHLTPYPSQIIYRHEYFINVSCAYPLDMNVSLATALNPIISTIIIKLNGIGQFIVKMALFKDPAYSIPREQGDELTTQDFLYIGVLIVEGDTSRFDLVMKNCFATPTQNFYGTLKYYIIKNSCENKNDKTISIAANGIASYGQFSVQAFKFLGGYNQIFLHCEVHLCDKINGFCVPVCPAGGIGNPGSDDSTISLGSIAIKDPAKLCPDLQCGASYINVTFKKSDLIDSNMDIETLHLNDNNCHDFHDSGSSVSIGWPVRAGQCGTTLITNATHAIYENAIHLTPYPSQIIYRHEYFINVSCAYPLDMNVSLHTVLNPIISTIYIKIEGTGQFEVIMAAFKDQTYLTPYQTGELELSTKDRLYIGVFISKGDTQQFNILMKKCYATPTNNPQDNIKYSIIQDSRPNEEDGTVEVYANGNSSQGQFSIQMFKFINHDTVYLHCEVHLCIKTAICDGTSRSANPETKTLSLGPIDRLDKDSTPTKSADKDSAPTESADKDSTPTKSAEKDSSSTESAGKGTYLDVLTILAVLLCWRFQ
ncbi:uncharacterized protein LOC142097675 isoform X2 [Mixophyes fleayi]|uniref:uncharacterized protein LOC142097675 isoform X2 n=1 Tax=Mixophyes fleayi TaxID=3061075 RepID=UPI003F4E0479